MISPKVGGQAARHTAWTMAALGVLGLSACTAELIEDFANPPPGPPTTAPAELRLISGDDQAGPTGSLLTAPLVVRIFDSTGVPFPGLTVSWTVTSGNGTIITPQLVTDELGTARAGWQLGDVAGTQTVTVSSPPLADVIFSANATPVIVAVDLQPSSVNLLTGGTQQFSAQGVFRDGSNTDVPVTYQATGGSITSNGLYTAGANPGTFRVVARQSSGTLADTAVVSISSPTATLTRITLSPSTASVVSGLTQQFTVSGLMSDGSTIVPAVTYNATGGNISLNGLYTAGANTGSFRVIATQTGGTLADTSTISVTAAPPPPPPPPPGTGGTPLFTSDWSTGTGSTDAVIRDNSKTVPWSARWGGRGSLAVVPASGLGFPAPMANVLRVQHYQQDFDWVMANNLWSAPPTGSAIYFRVYIRNTVANEVDAGSSYASTHPLEAEGGANSVSGGYYAIHYASYADGTFPFLFALNNGTYPYNGWTPGAPSSTHGGRNYDPATLIKNTTYRIEWKFTRTAANRYDMDMRIYGADDKTLLFDRSNIFAWGGNRQTLATNGNGLSIDDSHVADLRIGINGGFATPSPQFVYWGGFAVCANDWCGAYSSF